MSALPSHPPCLRTVTVFAIAIAMLAALGLSATADAKRKGSVKGPAGMKFYKAPKKKLTKRHGKLIWQRKAKGIVRLDAARINKLVLYTSKSVSGKRIAVSGSVHIPKGKKPKGGWPVVSYGHGTTGIADKCAPTRNRPNGPAMPYISYIDPELNELLEKGYAVVRTDYEGLGTSGTHPFLIGRSEGRGMLDIVRASRQLKKGLISKKFLIAGHSQGGHASLFAAGLAGKWVPDLKLRGTVAWAPASHIKEQVDFLPNLKTPSSLTALAALIVKGTQTVSKQIYPEALLSGPVLNLYPEVKAECLGRLAEPDRLGGIAPADLIRPGADLTPFLDVVGRQNPDVVSDAPIFMAQGTADTTTIPFLSQLLSDELLAKGNKLTYEVYAGADHGSVIADSWADVSAFLSSRLPSSR